MSIQATKRVETEFSKEKMIGLGEFEVLEFNKELDSDGKPIKYLGESKDGNTTFRVAVTLKEKKTGKYFPLHFFLEDKEVINKAGTSNQYINEIGRTVYADSVNNLSQKFVAYAYHKAKVGEAELINFLNCWLDIDRKKPYEITVDWKALMNGSAKELTDLFKSDLIVDSKGEPRTVCAMATVRVVEKDGEIKEYQQINNKHILAGYNMRYFRTTKFTDDILEALREKQKTASTTKKWLENYERFAIDVTDPQFGIKDACYLGELRPYTSEDNVPATDKILADEDSSY